MSEARHVAFLRAINIGDRRVTNDQIREAFEQLGCTDVTTYQASGNVVFAAREGETGRERLERGLASALGYEVPIFLRTAAETRAIASRQPFTEEQREASAGKPQVMLLHRAPGEDERTRAVALAPPGEQLRFGPRELHWLPAAGMRDSELDLDALERLLGPTTMRTHGTISRIAAKYL